MAFFLVISTCLALQGCARETQQRPCLQDGCAGLPRARAVSSRDAERPSAAKPSDVPFPETAFQDDTHYKTWSQPPPDRFLPRSIGTPSPPREFRGALVDLDLKGADIHDVFRLLADVGRTNVVVDGNVNATVTLQLHRIPWDEAMDVIARANGLVCEWEGQTANLILVRPQSAK